MAAVPGGNASREEGDSSVRVEVVTASVAPKLEKTGLGQINFLTKHDGRLSQLWPTDGFV